MSFVGITKVVYEMNQIETITQQNSQKKVLHSFFYYYYYYSIIIAKSTTEGKILDGGNNCYDDNSFIPYTTKW